MSPRSELLRQPRLIGIVPLAADAKPVGRIYEDASPTRRPTCAGCAITEYVYPDEGIATSG
jgi:hypothetical protein